MSQLQRRVTIRRAVRALHLKAAWARSRSSLPASGHCCLGWRMEVATVAAHFRPRMTGRRIMQPAKMKSCEDPVFRVETHFSC